MNRAELAMLAFQIDANTAARGFRTNAGMSGDGIELRSIRVGCCPAALV
jgi:hypothetical protein